MATWFHNKRIKNFEITLLYVLLNSLHITNNPPTLRDSLLELPPHVKTIKQTSGHIDGRVLYYS